MVNEKQLERAAKAAAKMIGAVVSVRTDPRTTVRGAISACRVLPPTTEAGKPQYEVTMICGVAAAVRTFVVAKLPPPDIIPVGPPAPGL